VEDIFFNLQPVVSRIDFATLDGTPPQLRLIGVNAFSANTPPVAATDAARMAANSSCAVRVTVEIDEQGRGIVAAVVAYADLSVFQDDVDWPSAVDNVTAWKNTWGNITWGLAEFFADESTLAPLVTIKGLPCDTAMRVIAVAQDLAGNPSLTIHSDMLTTPDVLPPVFLAETPRIAAVSDSTAWFYMQLDEVSDVSVKVWTRSLLAAAHLFCSE
jgi:hypothetical protein